MHSKESRRQSKPQSNTSNPPSNLPAKTTPPKPILPLRPSIKSPTSGKPFMVTTPSTYKHIIIWRAHNWPISAQLTTPWWCLQPMPPSGMWDVRALKTKTTTSRTNCSGWCWEKVPYKDAWSAVKCSSWSDSETSSRARWITTCPTSTNYGTKT